MPTATHAAHDVNGAHAEQDAHGADGGDGAGPFGPPGPPGDDGPGQGVWLCGETPLPLRLLESGSGAPGGGFGQGGILDALPPGPELGLLLPAGGDIAGLDDGELTGVVRGWRRMGSWAAAMEHAAVAELARRRVAEAQACGARSAEVPRYAAAEVAAALKLTPRGADGLMGRAMALAALPQTRAALAAGQIDMPKTLVIANGVAGLSAGLARAVEAQVLPGAGGQTTGELRKTVAAAVTAADPAAAGQRAADAQRSARVEQWPEPCGTAAIAGRDLPTASVLAAGNRISALAAALKADGAPGGIGLLRAQVFLGLLLGHPVAAPAPGTPPDAAPGTADITQETAPDAAAPAHGIAPGAAGAADGPAPGTAASAHGTVLAAAGATQETVPGAAGAGDGPASDPRSAVPQDTVPQDTVSGDAVSGDAVPGGAAARPAQPPFGAAGAGGSPVGQADEPEHAPARTPQAAAGGTEAIPAGPRRVPAGAGQLAGQPWAGWPATAGSVNLTVPLRALLGQPSQPAEAAGFGPLTPSATRELLTAAQHSPAVTWCLTVTGGDGRAVAHGCATAATGHPGQPGEPGGWALTVTVRGLETGGCSHRRESRGYQPAPVLRHLIQARHKTCAFPGCGRPAQRCDLDHTLAYQNGGRTCECNLAPLCRRHHKVKQALGWKLKQPSPGVLQWAAPSGWRYTVNRSIYPT